MTNRKSKTVRKIAALPRTRPARTCHPDREHETTPTKSKSRNTEHVTSSTPSESRITHHASLHPNHASRTRNGKVARLPYATRDMINRMLRNNIPHSNIVDALDELGFNVTERNISNWKTRGGYRDWCIVQDRALETRLLQDNLLEHLRKNDASQLAEVGLQLAATELSQFFLKPETRQQLASEPEKLARTIGILCRLARQIHTLQKYRDQSTKELGEEHNPELNKREMDETIENLRDIYSAEKLGESINEPDISHRNLLPKNGYPPAPPQDDPDKIVASKAREATHELMEAIIARESRKIAEAAGTRRTSPQTSPTSESERSDKATASCP